MSLHHTQGNGFRLSQSINKGRDVYWKHYTNTGLGRDTYIADNNGGLNTSYYEPSKGLSIGQGMYVGKN